MIKLIDILNIIDQNEQKKVIFSKIVYGLILSQIARYEEKMKMLSYSQNPTFEIELGKRYAPAIQKKIENEYAQSFAYLSPTQHFENSSVYLVQSSSSEITTVYTINKLTNFCSCLRVSHIGIPCRHLFSFWKYLGSDLLQMIEKMINKHWIIAFHNNIKIAPPSKTPPRTPSQLPNTSSKNKTKPPGHLIAVNIDLDDDDISKPVPDLFLVEPNIKNTTRKSKSGSPSKQTPSKDKKKTKLNDENLFNFISWRNNSCRFDCVLSLLYFFSEQDPSYLKKVLKSSHYNVLAEIFIMLRDCEFVKGQKTFIDFITASQLCKDSKMGFGSVTLILNNLLENTKDNNFFLCMNQVYWCSNTNCQIQKLIDEKQKVSIPIYDFNLVDYRDDSNSILDNFFTRYAIRYKDVGICECNSSVITTQQHQKEHTYEKYFEIESLPEYLFFNFESIGYLTEDAEEYHQIKDMIIDKSYSTVFKKRTYEYKLNSIIYFENQNHFTLAFDSPHTLWQNIRRLDLLRWYD